MTLFFLLNPVSFNGQSYQKQMRSGTSDLLLFRLWSKFTTIYLLVMYYLTKFDGEYKAVSELFQILCLQIYASQFMHHKLFHFHLSFWIWKVWKGRGKITKIQISRERKESFRWNKKRFSQFLKGYHLVKK